MVKNSENGKIVGGTLGFYSVFQKRAFWSTFFRKILQKSRQNGYFGSKMAKKQQNHRGDPWFFHFFQKRSILTTFWSKIVCSTFFSKKKCSKTTILNKKEQK
jgi:hypothetical protein